MLTLYTTPGVFSTRFLNDFTKYVVSSGRPCIYFSSDTVPWALIEKHDRAGGNIQGLLENKKLTLLNLYNSQYKKYSMAKHLGEAADSVTSIERADDPVRVLDAYRKMKGSRGRMGGVFESVPSFVTATGEDYCVNFFRRLILSNKTRNDVFIYKIQKGILSRRFEALMEELSDMVIELKRDAKNHMVLRKGNNRYQQSSVQYEVESGELSVEKSPEWAFWMGDASD